MSVRPVRTAAEFDAQRAVERRSRAFDGLDAALQEPLRVPPPATDLRARHGRERKLSLAAVELARQTYYLRGGSLRDCARALIVGGLVDVTSTDELSIRTVTARVSAWWQRAGWPQRSREATIALRDAGADGGLFRGRQCVGRTTGKGPAPVGKPCAHTALDDSEYCAGHDPRPEYVERRAATGRRFSEQRELERVSSAPLLAWLDGLAERLVSEARARGEEVSWRDRGRRRVAAQLGVHPHRLGQLRHQETLLARTVESYLARLDVSFRAVYGHEPPRGGREWHRCPSCGGQMGSGAKQCMKCHLGELRPCSYVNRYEERCTRQTRHESGLCQHCRVLVPGQELSA